MPDVASADSTIPMPALRGTLRMEESLANELLALLAGKLKNSDSQKEGMARVAAGNPGGRIGPVRFRDRWVELDFDFPGNVAND